jgi:hypothetical protein
MTTHHEEIWTTRIQGLLLGLALVGMVVIAISLGQWLATRFGQVPAGYSDYPQAPRVDLADLMASAR